jgi:hypothetical protein
VTPVPTATPDESTPGRASAVPAESQAGTTSNAPNAGAAPQVAANPLRVEAADAADRGIFETVIASLLSFFLG